MKTRLKVVFFVFISILGFHQSYGQDLSILAIGSPTDGCDLTSSELVSVVVYNDPSSSFATGSQLNINYTIDGVALVQENLSSGLAPGATSNYTFSTTNSGDFSACGEHILKVWVTHPMDTNQANDTLVDTIQNDCTVIPGQVLSNMTVCEIANNDTVVLDNWMNGSILDWEYSDATGNTWYSLSETDTFYEFNNLTVDTEYRVIIDGGLCPNDTSSSALVTVQSEPTPGTLSGANSVCASNASGTLQLSGNSGSIVHWESTTDDGVTWGMISNTTTSENYNNLTQTTWYRALIDGGACPNVYSDTAVIFVETTTTAGTLASDTSICPETPVDFLLSGKLGAVVSWQSSGDGGNTWTSVSSSDSTYSTSTLTTDTYFRVIVQNGICPEDTSNQVFVSVLPEPSANAGMDQTIISGETTTLSGTGGLSGIWVPGSSLSDSTVQSPEASPTSTTTYTYSVINSDGCIGSDNITVTVEDNPDPVEDFSIKNTITSNGDGYNDSWIIEGIEAFPNTYVAVYNIYGKEVYTSEDYQNEWKGTYNGKTLPNGTYMYVVTPGGSDDKLKGNLTILGNE